MERYQIKDGRHGFYDKKQLTATLTEKFKISFGTSFSSTEKAHVMCRDICTPWLRFEQLLIEKATGSNTAILIDFKLLDPYSSSLGAGGLAYTF